MDVRKHRTIIVCQGAKSLIGSVQKKCWLISPSHLGWPANRPRLYTLLIRKADAVLTNGGVRLMDRLYRIPKLTVEDMMLVPPETCLSR